MHQKPALIPLEDTMSSISPESEKNMKQLSLLAECIEDMKALMLSPYARQVKKEERAVAFACKIVEKTAASTREANEQWKTVRKSWWDQSVPDEVVYGAYNEVYRRNKHAKAARELAEELRDLFLRYRGARWGYGLSVREELALKIDQALSEDRDMVQYFLKVPPLPKAEIKSVPDRDCPYCGRKMCDC